MSKINSVEYQISLKDLLSGTLKKAQGNVKDFESEVDRAVYSIGSLNNAMMNSHAGSFMQTTGAVAIGSLLTRGIEMAGQAAVSQVKSILAAGLDAGKIRAEFGVLTGGKEMGDALFGDLNKYIAESVFGPELFQNAKTMMSMGIRSGDIIPTMKMLGDVAMGDAEKMKSLSLAYSQVISLGRLQGDNLRQMAEGAGFNPLQVLSESTGKSMAYYRDQMEKGNISASMMKEAFRIATSEGGKFFGMLDKIGETPFGKLQAMQGNIDMAKQKLGEALLPAMSDFMDASKPLIEALPGMFKQLLPTLESAIHGFASLAKWVAKNGDTIGFFARAVKLAAEAYAIWRIGTVSITAAKWLYNKSIETTILLTTEETAATNALTAATTRLSVARGELAVTNAAVAGASGLVNQFGVPLAASGAAASTGAAGVASGVAGLSFVGGALLVSLSAVSIIALSNLMADKAKPMRIRGGGLYDGDVDNSLQGHYENDTVGYSLGKIYKDINDREGKTDTIFNTKKRWVQDTVSVAAWDKMSEEQRKLINGMKPAGDGKTKPPAKTTGSAATTDPLKSDLSKVTGQQVKNIYVTINGGLVHEFTVNTTNLKESRGAIKRVVTEALADSINDSQLNN